MINDLTDLQNLGPTSVNWLQDIGIATKAELEEVGAVEAYCLIKAQHDQTSLNLLYALYGALHGLRWHELPLELKQKLQADVAAFHFGNE